MMKYFACLPIRRDLIQDTGKLHLLAVIDEENLSRCLHLTGQERKIHTLQKEIEALDAKLIELKK